eukprot:638872-Pelagomonas_calceolata.AAC.5
MDSGRTSKALGMQHHHIAIAQNTQHKACGSLQHHKNTLNQITRHAGRFNTTRAHSDQSMHVQPPGEPSMGLLRL